MRNIRASILGGIFSAATMVVAVYLSKPHALDLFAILLAFIAAVYLGFVLLDGRRREVVIEIVVIAVFFALAILGLWVTPYFLVIGYFAHGLWDVLHHPRAIQTKVVHWWPPFCLVVDWIIGGFIFWRWS